VKEENTAAAEWHRRRRNWARRQRRKRRAGQGQRSGATAPPTAQAATLEQRVAALEAWAWAACRAFYGDAPSLLCSEWEDPSEGSQKSPAPSNTLF